MTSTLPEPRKLSANGDINQNPNLVKDGGFKYGPKFANDECGYRQASAYGANMFLTYWEFGGNGNANGQPGAGKPGEYIDVRTHAYAFAMSDAQDKVDGSNSVDLVGRGNNRHGFVGQHIPGLTPGAQYEVTFWTSSHWYNETPHTTSMYYSVTDGSSRYGGSVLDKNHITVPPPTGVKIPGNSWARQWKEHRSSFTALSSEAYISFADETANGYWTGTQLACVAVRLATPAHDYRISRTDPAGSQDAPLSAAKDTPFRAFRLQILDENNQPLASRQVTLELEPRATGSHFVYGGKAPLTYTVKTDADGWVHVPAGALQAGPQSGPMQLQALLNGTRLGGQVDLKVGPGTAARFSLTPGGPPGVTLTHAGNTGYPGVQIHADQDAVPRQNIRVDLPAGRGLQFVPEGAGRCQLTVMDSTWATRSYDGTLSPDGQSLTFDDVDPALPHQGAKSAIWVAVRASGGAASGDTSLSFRVGERTSPSTPVHVQAG
ncbi:hypothetical protein [Streptomyces sp. NPDC046261]|uniref:hypothetical protein n=1 Tax=Streptomyces sp. NPDC046261 TaxID=3157200 RepID=UPI0033ED6BED